MIPVNERLQGVEQLVDDGKYFVIHAARQSGKTTYLQELAKRLNEQGNYYCLYCSLEVLQQYPSQDEGLFEIVKVISGALKDSKNA
jgi:predicted AAA+ superfamily ATPase